MDKLLKKNLQRTRSLKIRYMIACFLGAGYKWRFLRKNKVFSYIGKNVLFQPNMLPNDPQYIKLHDNVHVAAGVTFFNHDVINSVFNGMHNSKDGVLATHIDCIEIMENCFIGGNSIIRGGVIIGPNSIVAAGSVVVKDVPEGCIVGGNPAKVIGNFWDLKMRRENEDVVYADYHELYEQEYFLGEKRVTDAWKRFDDKHNNCR